MANPLTKTIMKNMVKQSPYKKEGYQQPQGNATSISNNLSEKEEQLLTSLMKKNSSKNYQNISSYQKSVLNNKGSNLQNKLENSWNPPASQVTKKTMTLAELAQQCGKEEVQQKNQKEEKKVTSSTKYMDLSSYVPTVSLNSIGKKGFNK